MPQVAEEAGWGQQGSQQGTLWRNLVLGEFVGMGGHLVSVRGIYFLTLGTDVVI